MVQEIFNLNKDSYLIIVGGTDKDNYQTNIAPYDKNTANNAQNLLNTATKTTVSKVALACITAPIVQNLASKSLSPALMGRISSAIYDIMADGAITNQEVAEDFIGSCTNHLDNIFSDLGYITPSALYTAIRTSGSYISKDFAPNFLNKFGLSTEEENKKMQEESETPKNVIVIKLKLIESDQEDFGIDIPTRKTENNFNIATAVNNQNPTRTFETKIVHNLLKSQHMLEIKNQLTYLRDTRSYVDVYVCDEDIQEIETIKDCLLSSLSFGKNGRNASDCSIGFTQVPKWKVKIDASLDKSLLKSSSSIGKSTGSKGGNSQASQKHGVQQSSNVKSKDVQVQAPKTIKSSHYQVTEYYNSAVRNIEKLEDKRNSYIPNSADWNKYQSQVKTKYRQLASNINITWHCTDINGNAVNFTPEQAKIFVKQHGVIQALPNKTSYSWSPGLYYGGGGWHD